ncbi:MAG: Usg family protein [Pseudomonadota bacterium]
MAEHTELEQQLMGYRLATAEILYHLPDHPGILQTFVWQDYDIAPRYPVLSGFLSFWEKEIEGKLHSVKLAGKKIVSAKEVRTGSFLYLQ